MLRLSSVLPAFRQRREGTNRNRWSGGEKYHLYDRKSELLDEIRSTKAITAFAHCESEVFIVGLFSWYVFVTLSCFSLLVS
jgi:hypothetical protein